jgi:uncharacterized membrane protein
MTFLGLLVLCTLAVATPPVARALGLATWRDRARTGAGVAFIVASLPHFLSPERYLPMMPHWLPWHRPLILLSGMGELAGGAGLLVRPTARAAAWGLAALLVAIFPANVHVALAGANAAGLPSAQWYVWSRLPLQGVFIWWILASVHARGAASESALHPAPRPV